MTRPLNSKIVGSICAGYSRRWPGLYRQAGDLREEQYASLRRRAFIGSIIINLCNTSVHFLQGSDVYRWLGMDQALSCSQWPIIGLN